MLKIHKECVLFELCLWRKKRRKKKDKDEDEARKINEIEIFRFGLSNLLKVRGTFGVDKHSNNKGK